jgi:hypothetical protein
MTLVLSIIGWMAALAFILYLPKIVTKFLRRLFEHHEEGFTLTLAAVSWILVAVVFCLFVVLAAFIYSAFA